MQISALGCSFTIFSFPLGVANANFLQIIVHLFSNKFVEVKIITSRGSTVTCRRLR